MRVRAGVRSLQARERFWYTRDTMSLQETMDKLAHLEKWQKLHEHVVEECEFLHAQDLSWHIPAHLRRRGGQEWAPPSHPNLRMVSRQCGSCVRWFLLCPECRRRCETLYILPGEDPDDWICRTCGDLIYASQRYGIRHPLRWKRTPRKRRGIQKAVSRQNRLIASRQEATRRKPPARKPPRITWPTLATADEAFAQRERRREARRRFLNRAMRTVERCERILAKGDAR